MEIDGQPDSHVGERVQGCQEKERRDPAGDAAGSFYGRRGVSDVVAVRQKMKLRTSLFVSAAVRMGRSRLAHPSCPVTADLPMLNGPPMRLLQQCSYPGDIDDVHFRSRACHAETAEAFQRSGQGFGRDSKMGREGFLRARKNEPRRAVRDPRAVQQILHHPGIGVARLRL
jgi:hypothetical protein